MSALRNRAGHLRKGAAALPSSANAVKAHCTRQTKPVGLTSTGRVVPAVWFAQCIAQPFLSSVPGTLVDEPGLFRTCLKYVLKQVVQMGGCCGLAAVSILVPLGLLGTEPCDCHPVRASQPHEWGATVCCLELAPKMKTHLLSSPTLPQARSSPGAHTLSPLRLGTLLVQICPSHCLCC